MKVRINLLPHREQKRAARQRKFGLMAIAAVAVGLLLVAAVHSFFGTRIKQQLGRNSFLEAEIAKLDKEIAEISRLKEQMRAVVARKQIVETLQNDRSQAVQLLDQLVRQLPDGVYLKALKQTGNSVNLQGYAQSNARVSTLMRNLEASPRLESPELVEIKAAMVNGLRVSEFSLNVRLTSVQQDSAAGARKGDKHDAG